MARLGGITRVDPSDTLAIKRAIGSLYESFRRGGLAQNTPSVALAAEYQARNVARKFFCVAQGVVGPRKAGVGPFAQGVEEGNSGATSGRDVQEGSNSVKPGTGWDVSQEQRTCL